MHYHPLTPPHDVVTSHTTATTCALKQSDEETPKRDAVELPGICYMRVYQGKTTVINLQ